MKGFTQNPPSSSRKFEFADLYLFTFTDGSTLLLTGHDRTIRSNGPYGSTQILRNKYTGQSFVFNKGPAIKRSKISWEAGVRPSELTIRINGNVTTLSRGIFNWSQAAQQGLLDWGTVQVWRAIGPFTVNPDGSITTGPVLPIFYGYLGKFDDITRDGITLTAYDARILLNQSAPRHVFTHHCRWTLFDAGCTLNRGLFANPGVVLAGSTGSQILVSLPQSSGYFDLGYVQMTSGKNVSLRADIATYIAAGSTYQSIILAGNPWAYFRFNDPAGTTAPVDISGHGRIGAVGGFAGAVTFGNPGLVTGDGTAKSAKFTATGTSFGGQSNGGQITITTPSPFTSPTWAGGFTIEFLLQPQYEPPSTVYAPLSVFDSAPGQLNNVQCWDRGQQFGFYGSWYPGFNVGDANAKLVGKTTHYALVFSSGRSITVFVNGIPLASVNTSAMPFNWGTSTANMSASGLSPLPFTIGATYNAAQAINQWFYGFMSEFAIYDYPFSQDQAFLHATAAGVTSAGSAPTPLSSGVLNLIETLPYAPVPGDTLIAYPGCDWTYRTCVNKFNNGIHYGGFPQIPEQEAGF